MSFVTSHYKAALAAALLLALAGAAPALAQKKGKVEPAPAAPVLPVRLQPLYGGLAPTQARELLGAKTLADIDGSFASRPEASRFFSQKGFEYLVENQADTAVVRFNLAWILDQSNVDAYRGLAVVASQRPGTPPEAIQSLLLQGLTLAPANSLLLADAATNTLTRYEQTKKKKDLTAAAEFAQRATAADSSSYGAWQALAHVRYYQEKYADAWQALHKAQNLNLASFDFQFVTELLAKMPDPEGKFK